MNNNDIDLRLLHALPIMTDNGLSIYSPLLKNIVDIGESRYHELLSIFLLEKDSLENEELKDVDLFDIFYGYCYYDEKFRETFFNSARFFMKEEIFIGNDGELPLFYFGQIEEKRWITQFNFDYIQEVIRKANFVKKKEKETYNPANEIAREFIEELQRKEASRPKPKETMNLMSIINGLAWRPNGVNIFNIFDLTLFQLYNGFFSTENADNYQFTLNGIYSGNVDGKKINLNSIHWAKILDK